MASNRHLGRIIALQTLYEQELRADAGDHDFNLDEVLDRNIARYKEMVDDVAFIRQLVMGVSERTAALDAMLQPVAPEWPIDQIARMDRLVLRIGLYELENEADVPPKVVINEAVELAKGFGRDKEAKQKPARKTTAKKPAAKKSVAKKVTPKKVVKKTKKDAS
jgi:N utilization substance protein B